MAIKTGLSNIYNLPILCRNIRKIRLRQRKKKKSHRKYCTINKDDVIYGHHDKAALTTHMYGHMNT